MAGSGIPTLILLIASLIAATIVSGVAVDITTKVSESIESRGESTAESIRTDISIVSNPEFIYNDSNNKIRAYIKNTGSNSIRINTEDTKIISFFVDNRFVTPDSISFVTSNSSPLRPGGVIEANISADLSKGKQHELKVTTGSNKDTVSFFVN